MFDGLIEKLEKKPWWGAVEQAGHTGIGMLAGLAACLLLFGALKLGDWTEWYILDLGAKHWLSAGLVGSAPWAVWREFKQNFLQYDGVRAKWYVDVDRDEYGKDNNDYLDMTVDLLFTAGGGSLTGLIFWIAV